MSASRISEVADRTGLPASTIRYYEAEGLVKPSGRGPNGYRQYGDGDVERLLFIAGAKRLSLGLKELRQLLAARESNLCQHVQADMHEVVSARLRQTEDQIADLSRLAEQLRQAEERLSLPATGGRCSDACACAVITGNDAAVPPAGATVLAVQSR